MAIGQELLNVPMGDMIRQMAFAIADAQIKLDQSSIEVAEMMGGLKTVYDDDGNMSFDDSRVFFGHEYMTLDEAKNYLSVDDALTGGDITKRVEDLAKAQGVDPKVSNAELRVPMRVSMLELGFTPTFYQFVDTIIEVKIAIKITRESSYTRKSSNSTTDKSTSASSKRSFWGTSSSSGSREVVQTSQVDATYSSKYGYSAEGSSLLRTKLTPLPPPPILEERIRKIMEQEDQRRQARVNAQAAKASTSTTTTTTTTPTPTTPKP